MTNETSKRNMVSRRTVLGTVGAAGLVGTLGVLAKPAMVRSADLQKVRLGWAQPAACHAPLAYAEKTGVFAKHGIDVELVDFLANGDDALTKYIASGKIDVGAGFLLGWLKPMDEGLDVRLISGTHAGCTRLLTTRTTGIKQALDLKGKTIAVAQSNGSAQQIFAVTLAKLGIDPNADVTWKVFPDNLLAVAVQKGEADALGHIDPQTFGWIKDEHLIEIANNQTGAYENLSCCTIGASTDFVKRDKKYRPRDGRGDHRDARGRGQGPRRRRQVLQGHLQAAGLGGNTGPAVGAVGLSSSPGRPGAGERDRRGDRRPQADRRVPSRRRQQGTREEIHLQRLRLTTGG